METVQGGEGSLNAFNVRTDVERAPDDVLLELQRFTHNVLPHLPEEQVKQLLDLLSSRLPESLSDDRIYGANYDIKEEVENLIKSVRALQNTVMDDSGRIRSGITPKEMREVVTSTSTLMTLLMKSHEKLLSMDRIRALEQATVETLRQLGGEEVVIRFIETMESYLTED